MQSCKSPLRYPGGKSRIADWIISLMLPHKRYYEPFVGGGSVFFHGPPFTERAILADKHRGLVSFYRCLKYKPGQFIALLRREVKKYGNGKTLFDRWASRRDLMEKWGRMVEQGVQYYILNRLVWGGRVIYDPERLSRLYFSNTKGLENLETRIKELMLASRALQRATVFCDDGLSLLPMVESDDLVYCDPPYVEASNLGKFSKVYEHVFTTEDHVRLAKALNACRGKVLVSYDNSPLAMKLYEGWRVYKRETSYCLPGQHSKADEIVFANFDVEKNA